MQEAQALVDLLLGSQNADGGWSYRKGSSWTDPTAFAVLALQAQSDPRADQALVRAFAWLLHRQKQSGGWSPNGDVQECTSVTSLATLAILPFARKHANEQLNRALDWTAKQVYPDDLSLGLLLARALHLPPAHAPGSVAWYPGTAGWVTPTALTALTLLRASRELNRPGFRDTALQSCSYLLSRRCVDNGWNHGGSKTRSEDATSYPETTGIALLALRAAAIHPPEPSISLARKFAAAPESVEGLAWIQMALATSGDAVPDPANLPKPRHNRDVALRLLSLAARQGKTPFLPT